MKYATTFAAQAEQSTYMRLVYNYMSGGVALAGLVGWFAVKSPAVMQFVASTHIVLALVWFGLGMFFNHIAFKTQPATALTFFAIFAALTGLMLSPIAFIYTGTNITLAFAAATAVFVAASLYGTFTKRSLDSLGGFLAVGSIALFIFALVLMGMSIFSTVPRGLSIVFSLLVIPFVTLGTAYETSVLRAAFAQTRDELTLTRLAIAGALNFFTDFVVLFTHILNLMRGNNE